MMEDDNWGADREKVIDFIYAFARMEYALKCSGYITSYNTKRRPGNPRQSGDVAEADWSTFASGHLEKIRGSNRLKESIDYLVNNPPRCQYFCNKNGKNSWEWGDRFTVGDDSKILDMVKQVRNNLFHGGKFSMSQDNSEGCDKERNNRLIQASLDILYVVKDFHPDVRMHYGS